MLDWLIIGGGVHGTHLALYLTQAKGVAHHRLRVLDPHRAPLARWNRLTANTGMAFLRSPGVHNLGLTPDALDKFAVTDHGRFWAAYRDPYHRPALDLFGAHNNHLIREHRLQELWIEGSAHQLTARANGWAVETGAGQIQARRVLLAIGRTQLQWPAWALDLAGRAPIQHIFEPAFDHATQPAWQHAVVIGGGITAAQLACTLAEQARLTHGGRITLLVRHPLRTAHFDSDPCWNGPKCLTKFHHTTCYTQRRAQIKACRYRGSLPHDVATHLHKLVEQNLICLCQAETTSAQLDPQGSVRLQLADGAQLTSDCVLLATGFSAARPGGSWLDRPIAAYGLACAECGYPIVDKNLCWYRGLHVTGPLAELELGTTAPNIRGARLATERIDGVM